MAFTKKTFQRITTTPADSVEVASIEVVYEDGNEIARNKHRHVITPGQDYSGEIGKVRRQCAAMHVATAITLYEKARALTAKKRELRAERQTLNRLIRQGAPQGPVDTQNAIVQAVEDERNQARVERNQARTAHEAFIESEDL